MAKKVSAIVSGAGFLTSVWTELDAAVRERGGTDEDLHRLATPDGKELIGEIAALIVQVGRKEYPSYRVTVDRKSLADAIAAGNYDYVNDDITAEHFPMDQEGAVDTEVVLVHFDRTITSDEAIREMERMGLVPAGIGPLTALSEERPDEQRKYSINALGSSWVGPYGYRLVPYLGEGAGGWGLSLGVYERGWYEVWRFLAVRTKDQTS